MKKTLLFALLTALAFGLITACTKKDDPAPISPIVGQWDLVRYTEIDYPAAYVTRNGSATANLGQDTYVFSTDGSYVRTQATGNSSAQTAIQKGTWALSGTVVTLNVPAANNRPASAYQLSYSATVSELSTDKIPQSQALTNPTTKLTENVPYNVVVTYKKK